MTNTRCPACGRRKGLAPRRQMWLDALRTHGPVSPTDLATKVGETGDNAATVAANALAWLARHGHAEVVERIGKSVTYRARASVTSEDRGVAMSDERDPLYAAAREYLAAEDAYQAAANRPLDGVTLDAHGWLRLCDHAKDRVRNARAEMARCLGLEDDND